MFPKYKVFTKTIARQGCKWKHRLQLLHRVISANSRFAMTSGDNKQCVLITGGAGYIGSHTAIEVIGEGKRSIVESVVDSREHSR